MLFLLDIIGFVIAVRDLIFQIVIGKCAQQVPDYRSNLVSVVKMALLTILRTAQLTTPFLIYATPAKFSAALGFYRADNYLSIEILSI